MNVSYNPYQESYKTELTSLIKLLYEEDPEGTTMTEGKINSTIQHLTSNPQSGKILVITSNEIIIGYSILINYWSNEFGGAILFLDELCIKPEYRRQSIGTKFIQHLIAESQSGYKAIFLEVFPSNKRIQ